MKILHVTLGLSPYRTGGLTKYSVDLMHEQSTNHEVYLLYPGRFTFPYSLSIQQNKSYKGINVYELINPNLVSLLNGINRPDLFMKKVDKSVYVEFLEKLKPDVLHIHTLMGVHKELFEAAKELELKIIFTTHDYFGLCPKVNLIDSCNRVCEDFNDGQKCLDCNVHALSTPMIHVMQSYTYRYLKNSKLVKSLRYIKKNQSKKNVEIPTKNNTSSKIDHRLANQYIDLRNYYLSMLKLVDYFHFNSSVAKEQYGKYLDVEGKVISISHSDIIDNRQTYFIEDNPTKPLNITYLGPVDQYKGFYFLKDSLKQLLENGQENWHLNVYGDFMNDLDTYDPRYFTFNGKYQYSDLHAIFSNTDVLVIPSLWKETFGFIGLEALSYGVPTLVSENVGFKDMIEDGKTGMIFTINKNDLANKLNHLIENRTILKDINANLLNINFSYSMNEHTNEIINLYKQVGVGVGS
ncbi:glycosyltransferase [Bacillus sp. RG28]|uniref:Glycosyltransferase n=1 Tax=Gottfriedia endophytica TaxID=2820819 RepID=A0A940NJ86_9BACI|nr:glycosyltransferase [Gottfriedia endophytica]MBP0725127.1 glycosyltransferase [Gottfriedia endophytica]